MSPADSKTWQGLRAGHARGALLRALGVLPPYLIAAEGAPEPRLQKPYGVPAPGDTAANYEEHYTTVIYIKFC